MQITTPQIVLFIILSLTYCYISCRQGKKHGYLEGYIQGRTDCLVNVVNTIDECFHMIPKGHIKDEEKN